jgi:hypothetical protein
MKVLQIKLKNKGSNEDCSYKNEINPFDAQMIALVLNDLETMFSIPIKKAVSLMNKDIKFPF